MRNGSGQEPCQIHFTGKLLGKFTPSSSPGIRSVTFSDRLGRAFHTSWLLSHAELAEDEDDRLILTNKQ